MSDCMLHACLLVWRHSCCCEAYAIDTMIAQADAPAIAVSVLACISSVPRIVKLA